MGAGALASDTLVVACVCLQSCAGETQKHGMVDARPSRTFSPLLLPLVRPRLRRAAALVKLLCPRRPWSAIARVESDLCASGSIWGDATSLGDALSVVPRVAARCSTAAGRGSLEMEFPYFPVWLTACVVRDGVEILGT